MIIDWFTVFAQIINFLVLVFLLKIFLYRPIFEAINKRKEEIESSIESAKEKENEAQRVLEEYEKKKNLLEGSEKKILEDAHVKAAEYFKQKNAQLDKEIDELKKKKTEKINKDQKNFEKYAAEKFTKVIFELSHRVIEELSSQKLEALMFDKFLEYLSGELPKIKTLISKEQSIRLSTAFELSSKQKSDFREALGQVLKNAECRFITRKENLIGVNLLIDTYEISWNASEALLSIEKEISESISRAEFLRQA